MTLHELLGLEDPDVWERFTTEELETVAKPFWPTCRPELVVKKEEKKPVKKVANQNDLEFRAQVERAKQLAAAHGIKLKI